MDLRRLPSKAPEATLAFWVVKILATTLDRSLGIDYPGGPAILFTLLQASLGVWYWPAGSVSVNTVTAILFSQTLGTAVDDWIADTNGLGYEGGRL
jgi:uncharacterized membrane-anchored protein